MSNLKNFYNKFWKEDRGEFESYIRNINLFDFFKKGELVLDVGCGDGIVGDFLQKKIGVKVIGIDISKEAVKKANKKGVKAYLSSSEETFPFNNDTFDAIFWGDNIEHLFNPFFCAKEIRRVLKRGGRLILSCPNMGYWRYRIHYLLQGRLPDTEWTGLPPWQWSHIRFFNLDILRDFLKNANFNSVSKVVGVSSRRLDKPFLAVSPTLFGMILIIEAK